MSAQYFTDVSRRDYLRRNAIEGARKYLHYLVDKDFLILCEDGDEHILHFYKADFVHLTGIKSNLNDDNFYKNCINGHLDVGNIEEYQKYNWSTLKSKSVRVAPIHKMLYDSVQGSLFMINLHTNTTDFPVAIKNTNIDACIGFCNPNNKARTLRKYNSSNNADQQKKILLVVAKRTGILLYDELVYVSDIRNIYDVNGKIVEQLSDVIQNKFLEILTKPA